MQPIIDSPPTSNQRQLSCLPNGLQKLRMQYLSPKSIANGQIGLQQNVKQNFTKRLFHKDVPTITINQNEVVLSPKFMQKSLPHTKSEPVFEDHIASKLFQARSTLKQSYTESRKRVVRVQHPQSAEQVADYSTTNQNKVFRRMLKQTFDPVPSFLESQDTYSEDNYSAAPSSKKRDFIDSAERLRFEKTVIKQETNVENLLRSYEQILNSNLDLLQEHRINHFSRVLEQSVSMGKHTIPEQTAKCQRILAMIKNYYSKTEMTSVTKQSVDKLKLPKTVTTYFKILLKCPQRVTLLDLRSAELNPRGFALLQREFHEECCFNQYVIEKLVLKEHNKWNRRQLEMMLLMEKVFDDVNQKIENTFQLQQIIKFADEIRKGQLVGDLMISQVEEEIVQMKNQIMELVDKLADSLEDDHPENDAETKMIIRGLQGLKNQIKHAITAKQREAFKKYQEQATYLLTQ